MHREPQAARVATVLIVDDRPTNRQFLSTLLGYGGHRLLEAADGAEALRLVKAERPDLVISDILMPTMDGFEFAKSVRADPEIAATKIVFYTATYRATEAALLAKACGVSVVIAKPAEPQRVIDVVNEQLGIPQLKLVPQAMAKPAEAAGAEPSGSTLSHLGVQITDYVNDLRGVKMQLDGLVERGLELEKEREHLRGISTTFAQNVAQLHTTSGRLYALVELGMDLTQEQDAQRLLQVFTGAARRLLEAGSGVTVALQPNENLVQHVATEGLEPGAARAMQSIALGDGVLEKILATRKVLRLAAPAGKKSVAGLPAGHPPVKSLIGAAIASAGGCYGAAFFTDKRGGAAQFDEEDERMLQALAAQLAVTYEKLELHDTTQRHAATLQVEIEERKGAQQAQAESERRFRQLAENIHQVFFLIDPSGNEMLYVSPAYEEVWGRSCKSLYDSPRSWTDAVHADDRAMVFANLERMEQSGQFGYEYRITRPDGALRWMHARGFPIRDAAGKLYRIAGIAEDITERKQSEEKIRRLNRVYAVLSGINTLIVRASSRDELFREACRIAVEQGQFRMAWIGMADGAARVKPMASAGEVRGFLDSAPLAALDGKGKRQGMAWQAIVEKKAVISNDVQNDSRTIMKKECLERGVNSLVMLPLVVGAQSIGVLAL